MYNLIRMGAVLTLALVAGYSSGGDEQAAPASATESAATLAPRADPTMDTTNARAIDGLSRDQLERRAEPVKPEQAEQIGVPTPDPDSVVPSAP